MGKEKWKKELANGAYIDFLDGAPKTSLIYMRIGAPEAKDLAEVLKEDETVTSLWLCDNNIGDEGAKYIAEALKGNRTITALSLSRNNIGDKGATALALALKANTNLTYLYIYLGTK
ncbi:MAG: hypothetical protein K0R73_175 [Candidatus Midichloriaceae bacterium]|jgi:hypothetical protein|nr:hypothetical protein [Candidatus Midichloriaceae bacterium]